MVDWFRENTVISTAGLTLYDMYQYFTSYGQTVGYIYSLSNEDLEALSEILVNLDLSENNIEEELQSRVDSITETESIFQDELLQESIIEYLDSLRETDPNAFDRLTKALSNEDSIDSENQTEEKVKSLGL